MRDILNRSRIFVLGLLLVILGVSLVLFFQAENILAEAEKDRREPTVLRDRRGTAIKHLGTNPVFVPLAKIPLDLQQAVLDFEGSGLARSLAGLIYSPKGVGGRPKAKILPTVLKRRYSQKKILEMYLNQTDFGEGTRGVEAASRTYFGKPAEKLALTESALLAALAHASGQISPFGHPHRSLELRNQVLEQMHAKGHLDKEKKEQALRTPLDLEHHLPGQAHFFADYADQLLRDKLGEDRVVQEGLEVQTTLDLKLQTLAEEIFKKHATEGALIALEPLHGGILTMVGGLDYLQEPQNQATTAHRQVGSLLRPFIYGLALQEGWAMNHLVEDAPHKLEGYKVENEGGGYWGAVTMKHALALDLNNAALWTLKELGAGKFVDLARRVGLDLHKEDGLTPAIGELTRGLSLLDLTRAYLPFSNEGEFVFSDGLIQVSDAQGTKILGEEKKTPKQVFSKEEAYLLTNMLQAKPAALTAPKPELSIPAALHTSWVSQQSKQWCLGYTPTLVVGVCLPTPKAADQEDQIPFLAGEIWGEFVEKAALEIGKGDFTVPKNVETDVLIDIFSGLLANERCPHTEADAFIKGTAPTELAPCAQPLPQEPLTRPGAPLAPQPEPPITQPPAPPTVPEPEPPPTQAPEGPEVPSPPPLEPEEPQKPPKPQEPSEPGPAPQKPEEPPANKEQQKTRE